VIGLGEAGLRAAANGRRFSIVTLEDVMRAALVIDVRVGQHRLAPRSLL
jgi:Asp/Glu/hydantoin racemase